MGGVWVYQWVAVLSWGGQVARVGPLQQMGLRQEMGLCQQMSLLQQTSQRGVRAVLLAQGRLCSRAQPLPQCGSF